MTDTHSTCDTPWEESLMFSAREILILSTLLFVIITILVVAGWSALLVITGQTGNGGPLAALFHMYFPFIS